MKTKVGVIFFEIEEGPWTKKCSQSLNAEKNKEIDTLLEPFTEQHPDLSLVSHFWLLTSKNCNKSMLFEATKLVVISYNRNREQIPHVF